MIDRQKLKELLEREERKFVESHPKSKELFERAKNSLVGGVPMNWMVRWGPFPIFVKEAEQITVTDVDNKKYIDFCLGDTGSMFGHSPSEVVSEVGKQLKKGITMMLPTPDSIIVGEELKKRFGLPYWQISMSATDANRNAIRLARHVTKRQYILVFNGCYHGTVDETLVNIRNGKIVTRAGNMGPPVDPNMTTRIVEFNDVPALEAALATKEIAAVLCEPAMTNRGIILPDPGFHNSLRELTRKYGTLLIIDETHTICCGPGGYTGAYGLQPDMVTLGKPIGSGIPGAAYGVSQQVSDVIVEQLRDDSTDENGLGGTLSGNAVALCAMRHTLQKVITQGAFDKMTPLAERFEKGIIDVLKKEKLPWHVTRLGVRVEYHFTPKAPRNGGEYEATRDNVLGYLMHLMCLNRGMLLTPFHNMALMSPYTTEKQVDYHTKVFEECAKDIKKHCLVSSPASKL